MGKIYKKPQAEKESEERLMELYDKLASQWARKVESTKGKI